MNVLYHKDNEKCQFVIAYLNIMSFENIYQYRIVF